jgi:RHS repeat-associated protein
LARPSLGEEAQHWFQRSELKHGILKQLGSVALLASLAAGAARADNPPPPQLTITAPADGLLTNATTVTVSGTAFASPGAEPVTVTIDSIPATVNPDGTFTGTVVLNNSWNSISVSATDALGQETYTHDIVWQDATPPSIYLFNIWDGAIVSWNPVVPACGANDDTLAWATFTLDGAPYVCGDPIYDEGQHTIFIDAMDRAGNENSLSATFVIDRTPPAVTFTGASEGQTVPGPASITVNVTDQWEVLWSLVLIDGAQTYDNPIVVTNPGNHAIYVSASDAAYNGTFAELDFTVGPSVATGPMASCQLSGTTDSLRAGQVASFAFTGLDASGQIVSGAAGSVAFAADVGAHATLPGAVSFTDSDAWQRTVSGFSFSTAGDWNVSAASSGVSCSTTVHVTNDVASRLVMSGLPSAVDAGTSGQLLVQAVDQFGNVAVDYLGTVSFATSAQEPEPVHQAFLPGDLGSHTFTLMFSVAGADRVLTVADDADPTIQDSATTFVNAGDFAQFVLADTGVPARSGFARNVGITAMDAFGNVIPSYTGIAHFSSTDSAAILPPDFAFTGTENGEAVLDHALTLRTQGSQTLQVADGSGAGATASQAFSVAPAPAGCAGLSGSNWTGSAVMLGWCDFAAGSDLYSVFENGSVLANLVPGFTYPVTGLVPGNGYSFAVEAEKQQGARGGCGTFQSCLVWTYVPLATTNWSISGPPPAVALSLNGLPSTMQTGTPAKVTVRAMDAGGNVVPTYAGTVHFTSSDSHAVLPADATFAPQDQGVKTLPVSFATPGSSSVTVTDVSTPSITGNQSGIAVVGPVLPPDPTTVAPPVDMHVASALVDSTAFLYSGPNPIQTGVLPGTIDVKRVSVIRGSVFDVDGNGLGGVAVTIDGHPEFGQTLSRMDGGFDLAVNGGGTLTVDFARDGYHPAQRHVEAIWQNFVTTQAARMVPLDPKVTVVDLGDVSFGHMLKGSAQTDARGTRTTAVFIPPGTQASLTMPDGTTQALPSNVLHMRVTEYTVGDGGEDRMPATLPPTSRYTFAAAFTADEEIAAGAKNLVFNHTVFAYVDNFLGFPVGTVVPNGYYDHKLANWVPQDNGVIVGIVGVDGAGQALIDSHGDGNADSDADLVALDLSASERVMLASSYSVGQSLWRAPMQHFSDYDLNWGPALPPGAAAPILKKPDQDHHEKKPCIVCASIIEAENQTLGERTAVVGTPYTLNYRSDRQWGKVGNRRIGFPLAGVQFFTLPGDPNDPYGVSQYARIEVTGERTTFIQGGVSAATNQFEWDGLDAYGRRVQGSVPISLTVCNSGYPGIFYDSPAETFRSFAAVTMGGGTIQVSGATKAGTAVYTLCSPTWHGIVGGMDVKPLGLGGWTISPHHAYDPVAGVIYKGDGTRQDAHDLNQPRAEAVYGYTGTATQNRLGFVEGAKVTKSSLFGSGGSGSSIPSHISAAPDGSLFVARAFDVWKIGPDEIIHRVAGDGTAPLSNGMRGLDANFDIIQAIAAGLHGEVFVTLRNHYIVKIDASGILTIAAGTGQGGFSADGAIAAQSPINLQQGAVGPQGLAVHPDTGLLYFADPFNNRIRMITPDGRLLTIAGGGPSDFNILAGGPAPQFGGDGGDARAATALLDSPGSIVFGPAPQRQLYFLDTCNRSVRTVDATGALRTIVGSGLHTCNTFNTGVNVPRALGATSDGLLLITQPDGSVVVANPITLQTYTMSNGLSPVSCRDADCPASASQGGVWNAVEFTRAPDNTIYFMGTSNALISRLVADVPITAATPTDTVLASGDGTEVYVFDGRGRHLRTLDALTNVPTQVFGYDNNGLLVTVTDRSGNVTTIQRDGAGNPTAIVGPYGQVTTLQLGSDGYLATITNPSNESWSMQYFAGGMLSQLVDARNGTHGFTYDGNGYLASDTNALNETINLNRNFAMFPNHVVRQSPMNRFWSYTVGLGDDGTETITRTEPTGLVSTTVLGANHVNTLNTADGMTSSVTELGDPRFGLSNSPYSGQWTEKTPSGLTLSGSATHSASLSDPNDPLSLVSLADSTTINGRTFSSSFVASTKTMTYTSPAGRLTTMTLDASGRVSQANPPGVTPVQFHYDANGRNDAITQGTRVTSFHYAPNGFLDLITDPAGQKTSIVSDASGRPTLATQPDLTTVAMSYDPSSNVSSVTPPGRPPHQFSYDLNDNETLYTPPDAGAPMSTATSYDADQEVTLVSRPDGDFITPSYDPRSGRLTSVTTSVGLTAFGYAPDGGQLTSITAPGETLSYGYDGALFKSVTWSGAVTGTLQRTYDSSFRVQSETVAGTTINYTYDNDDLLTKVGSMNIPRDPTTGFVSSGNTLGTLQESNTYDQYGAPQTYTVKDGSGNLIYAVDYGTRDSLGRIVHKTETIQGQTHTYDYGYDSNGRLVNVFNDGIAPGSMLWNASATYASGALVTFNGVEYASLQNTNTGMEPDQSPAWWQVTHAYAYDANGNRLFAPGLTNPPVYDAQDRMLAYGDCTYSYKKDGSLQTKTCSAGTTTYDYDPFGNLRHVGLPNGNTIDHVIDGQNRRVGKKVNGVMVEGFLYRSQLQPAAWLNGDGSIRAIFVYGLHANVPEYMVQSGTTYRLITDQVGSVRLVENISTGAVVERIDFDEYGNVLADTAPGTQPFGFAGGLRDLATGLTRFGARDYDAMIGRWTAKDPLRFEGGQNNLYLYVAADPVNFLDPRGRDAATAAAVLAAYSQGLPWLEAAAVFTGPLAPFAEGALAAGEVGLTAWNVYEAVSSLPMAGERTEPNDLLEELALAEAQGGAGCRVMKGKIKDPKYPEDTWAKMEHVVKTVDEAGQVRKIVIHYWENLLTALRHGFKFK